MKSNVFDDLLTPDSVMEVLKKKKMLNQIVYVLLIGCRFIYLCDKKVGATNSFLKWSTEQKAVPLLQCPIIADLMAIKLVH